MADLPNGVATCEVLWNDGAESCLQLWEQSLVGELQGVNTGHTAVAKVGSERRFNIDSIRSVLDLSKLHKLRKA